MAYIPTELLVDILQRLPSTTRRRLRLVSRSWRDLIHQRTPEMKQQRRYPVPLVVTTETAYILDDLKSKTSEPRELWPIGTAGGQRYKHMEVVGACNGVLCLCDDTVPGGAITLVNPATGDSLALPQIPCHGLFRRHNTRCSGRSWHQAYSFGYHHERGQYKVVHVPCFFKTKDTLQVFTLGEASWREVPAPGDRCRLDAGIVSVNGATYWVVERSERIVCFDFETEQVKTTNPPPVSARPICYLTEVESRLSIATARSDDTSNLYFDTRGGYGSLEVWILENTRKEQTWIHQYSLRFSSMYGSSLHLARPNFFHDEYVLMVGPPGVQGQKLLKYQHQHEETNYYVTSAECSAVHNNYCLHKGDISHIRGHISRTFTYIKTTEALSVYKCW